MISSTLGRPPAKPVTEGGPVRMSGAISLVKRSTSARDWPRGPRSLTGPRECLRVMSDEWEEAQSLSLRF
jgi:hypothetical protein